MFLETDPMLDLLATGGWNLALSFNALQPMNKYK